MNKQKERGLDYFSVACFPVGTVFEINDDVRYKDYHPDGTVTMDSPILTATGIVRNGYQSYVVTTDQKHTLSDGHTMDRSLNTVHVKRIIKRGTGPLLISHGWYGVGRKGLEYKARDSTMDVNLEGVKRRKGFYYTYSLHDVLHWELARVAKPGDLFNTEEFISSICAQTWCRLDGYGFMRYHVINKKRLRAFIKANRNHFLADLTKATKAYEEEMARMYHEDWEIERKRDRERDREKFYVNVGDLVKVQVYDGELEVESVDPEDDMVTCVGTADRDVRVVVHASGIEVTSRLSAYDAGYDYGEIFFGDDDADDIVDTPENDALLITEQEVEEGIVYVEPASPDDLV